MSLKHLEDILARRLQNVLKMSWRRFCRRLEDVLKTSWKLFGKTSWRSLENVLARRLEDVLKTYGQDEYIGLDQDILKTSSEDKWQRRIYSSWSLRLEDVFGVFWRRRRKTSSRRLHVCWVLSNNYRYQIMVQAKNNCTGDKYMWK